MSAINSVDFPLILYPRIRIRIPNADPWTEMNADPTNREERFYSCYGDYCLDYCVIKAVDSALDPIF